MRIFLITTTLIGIGLFTYSASLPAKSVPAVSFNREIAPILENRCAICHLTGQEAGKISLVPARVGAAVVNKRSRQAAALMLIKPGKPDESYLIMKLEGSHLRNGGAGVRMPASQAALPAREIATFRRWVAQGATTSR